MLQLVKEIGIKKMTGIIQIEITESGEELKQLLEQVTDNKKARVQTLYWLKIGAVETTEHLAVLLNCHRTTVSRWLRLYREGGMPRLLEYRKSSGRPPLTPSDALESLQKELTEPEGFNSSGEIEFWLKFFWELYLCYWTV